MFWVLTIVNLVLPHPILYFTNNNHQTQELVEAHNRLQSYVEMKLIKESSNENKTSFLQGETESDISPKF